MKTRTKPTLDRTAKLYILDTVETDGEGKELPDDAARIDYIRDRFKGEAGWNVERSGEFKAMYDWLQGLALDIEFNNYDILQLAKQWGTLAENPTEKQEDKILDSYWGLMATKTLQLINGYRIPKRD